MICSECHAVYNDELTLVHLQDDGLYDVICPEGHQTTVRLANEKFELLFDSSGLALLDGYLYEAVSSIAVALERFREFYIRVIALKHLGGKESGMERLARILSIGEAFGPLEQTWKKVKQQAERQYGAFLFLYLLETGKPSPFVDAIHMKTYGGKEFPPRRQTATATFAFSATIGVSMRVPLHRGRCSREVSASIEK
jgi:hypothetical protein